MQFNVIAEIGNAELNLIPLRVKIAKNFEPQKIPVVHNDVAHADFREKIFTRLKRKFKLNTI